MKYPIYSLMVALLCSCVGPGTRSKIDRSIGMKSSEVIEMMGIPDEKMELDGLTVYRYVKNCSSGSTNVPTGYGMSVQSNAGSCDKWTFSLSDGTVIKAEYDRGPGLRYKKSLAD